MSLQAALKTAAQRSVDDPDVVLTLRSGVPVIGWLRPTPGSSSTYTVFSKRGTVTVRTKEIAAIEVPLRQHETAEA